MKDRWASRWGGVIVLVALAGTCASEWSQSTAPNGTPPHDPKSVHEDGAKIDWNAPLPSAAQLKDRVLKNLKQYDMFFVNGEEIDELTGKDGKALSEDQKNKEMERVQKEIKKDSDAKFIAKRDARDDKQLDSLLHMLRYTNGHRVDRGGRSTLAYDLSGDPTVHPKGVVETFLHDMSGSIEVDEKTGELVDLNARLDHDVKIGGGLVASLHKGFWIHVRQQRYPDGVWLTEMVEGNGDARAALFFHPYFKFKQTMNGCALTSVTTSQGASSIAK
jgi:hypothetical protein